jgi:hypothetical protein
VAHPVRRSRSDTDAHHVSGAVVAHAS